MTNQTQFNKNKHINKIQESKTKKQLILTQ